MECDGSRISAPPSPVSEGGRRESDEKLKESVEENIQRGLISLKQIQERKW